MELQNEFEAATDLLLGDGGDCDDLLECARDALLPAGDVEARSRYGLIGAAFQIPGIVNHREEADGKERQDNS